MNHVSRRVVSIAASLFSLGCPLVSTKAEASGPPTYYAYHPGTTMALGHGFDPLHLDADKAPCITFEIDNVDGSTTALSTDSVLYVSRSKEELRSQLGVDAEVEAHFLVFNANAHYTLNTNRAITSDAATFIFYFKSEYSRQSIKNWKYTEAAQALINARNFDQFRRDCGSEVVLMVRRAAMVAAVLTVHNIDATAKSTLTSHLEGGVSLLGFGGGAKATMTQVLDTAAHDGNLEIQLVSTGGAGFGALKEALDKAGKVGEPDVFAAVTSGLGTFLHEYSATNAAPIGFNVNTFPGVSYELGDLWGEEKQSRLLNIVDRYREVADQRTAIRNISDATDVRSDFLTDEQRRALPGLLSQLNSYAQTLAAAHAACLAAAATQLNPCGVPDNPVVLPAYVYPTDKMLSMFALIVDGEPWFRARAAEVLEDAGSGDLLAKVQRRKPGASSAYIAVGFSSPFLSDVTLLLKGSDRDYVQNVTYPGRSTADAAVTNRSEWSFIALRGSHDNTAVDWPIHDRLLGWIRENKCVGGFLEAPAPNTPLTLRVVAKGRNRYGFVRELDVATVDFAPLFPSIPGDFRRVFPTGISTGLLFFPSASLVVHPAWGEQPFEYFLSDRMCHAGAPAATTNRVTQSTQPSPNAPRLHTLAASDQMAVQPRSVTRFADRATVCVGESTISPEGRIRRLDSGNIEICRGGRWMASAAAAQEQPPFLIREVVPQGSIQPPVSPQADPWGAGVRLASMLMSWLADVGLKSSINSALDDLRPEIDAAMPSTGGVLVVVGIQESQQPAFNGQYARSLLDAFVANSGSSPQAAMERYLSQDHLVTGVPDGFVRKNVYFWITKQGGDFGRRQNNRGRG